MTNNNKKEIFLFYLLSFIPLSIITGPSISLINVILLNFFFFFFLFKFKNLSFSSNKTLKIIFFLYFYLIFNSFISIDPLEGIKRNLGFLRYVILFVFLNYYFFYFKQRDFLKIWFLIISIFVLDVYIEFFNGSNILGWGAKEIDGVIQPHAERIVSFFKDEPIAGSFMSGFIFLIFFYFLKKFKKNKFIPFIFLGITFFAIFFTGERSNTIKVLIGIIIFLGVVDFIKFRTKVLSFIIFLFCLFFAFNNSQYLKTRYYNQFINKIDNKEKFVKFTKQNLYFKLYNSGFEVFKNHPIFGVGNKNYRVVTCENDKKLNKPNYICQTHPHQIYIELLAEHGLIGTIIILIIIYLLIHNVFFNALNSKNYIQLGCCIYVIINFVPLLPSGSFFSDFNSNLFWINLSLMYATSDKTNIFFKKITYS